MTDNQKHLGTLVVAILLAISALISALTGASNGARPATGSTSVQSVNPAPAGVVNQVVMTLFSYAGITQGITSTAVIITDYALGDCYNNVTMGTVNTDTVSIQHSIDNKNFATSVAFSPVIASGTDFTRTEIFGNFTRVTVALANTNAITGSVACKLLNLK